MAINDVCDMVKILTEFYSSSTEKVGNIIKITK